jgi:hypothetical protein
MKPAVPTPSPFEIRVVLGGVQAGVTSAYLPFLIKAWKFKFFNHYLLLYSLPRLGRFDCCSASALRKFYNSISKFRTADVFAIDNI